MHHLPVVSSNIASLAYCDETQTLQVAFQGRGGLAPRVYQYTGVPAWVYTAMRNAPSVGSYFAQFVKGKYPTSPVG
jgi:hypothetical protein